MLIRGATREQIEHACTTIGVCADINTLSSTGIRHRVKLYPNNTPELYRPACKRCRDNGRAELCRCRRWPEERGDARYQRVRHRGDGARVNAVCWHGFRDFFRALFAQTPNATCTTSLDTWQGSADFEARFAVSGHKNIGSMMQPMAIADACRCPDSGSVSDEEYADVYTYNRIGFPHEIAPHRPVLDTYGADEAHGAANAAMANALRVGEQIARERREARKLVCA